MFVFNFILVLQHFSEKITKCNARVQNRMLCSVILIGEYIRNRTGRMKLVPIGSNVFR